MTNTSTRDLEPIAATRAKVIFGEILHQTSVNGRRYVVNRQGKPISVILGYNEYGGWLRKGSRPEGSCRLVSLMADRVGDIV